MMKRDIEYLKYMGKSFFFGGFAYLILLSMLNTIDPNIPIIFDMWTFVFFGGGYLICVFANAFYQIRKQRNDGILKKLSTITMFLFFPFILYISLFISFFMVIPSVGYRLYWEIKYYVKYKL